MTTDRSEIKYTVEWLIKKVLKLILILVLLFFAIPAYQVLYMIYVTIF